MCKALDLIARTTKNTNRSITHQSMSPVCHPMPISPATWEAEARAPHTQSQPGLYVALDHTTHPSRGRGPVPGSDLGHLSTSNTWLEKQSRRESMSPEPKDIARTPPALNILCLVIPCSQSAAAASSSDPGIPPGSESHLLPLGPSSGPQSLLTCLQ